MPETRRREAAQDSGQGLSPGRIAVLQRQARQGQPQERRHHDRVADAMERHEPHVGRLARPQAVGPAMLEDFDQPADEPQHRMDAEEREGRVQERQQGDVDGVDHRVLLGVGRSICGLKFTKLARALAWHLPQVCTRFAGESVELGSSKGRISMRTVTVGALGGRAVAQRGQFAVHAQGIRTGHGGVAVSTAVGQGLAEGERFGRLQFVPLVAGGAGRLLPGRAARRGAVGLPTQTTLAVYACSQVDLRFLVALAAGVGNVGYMDRGAIVVGEENIVRAMAIGAARPYREPLLFHRLTVDAAEETLHFILVFLDPLVAAAAGLSPGLPGERAIWGP